MGYRPLFQSKPSAIGLIVGTALICAHAASRLPADDSVDVFATASQRSDVQSTVSIRSDDPAPIDPIDAEMQFHRGIQNWADGHYEASVQELGKLPQDPAGQYARGILLLKLGRSDDAAKALAPLQGNPELPPDASVYLAVAQLQCGHAAAAEQTIRTFLKNHAGDRRAHCLLGLALARQRRHDEARKELAVAGVDPKFADGVHAASYEQSAGPIASGQGEVRMLMEDLPGPGASASDGENDPLNVDKNQRRWNLTILNALEYDSNLRSSPVINGLGDNFRMDDDRYVLAMFGEYRIVQESDWNVGLLGSSFDTWHFSQDEFDLQDYMGGAYTNKAIGEHIVAGVRYEFHDTLLGRSQYATEHRIVPNVSWLTENGHTTLFYEFDATDSNAPHLINDEIQTGNVNAVGVTQAIYTFEKQGRIFLGYRFENAQTKGTDYDRNTNMVSARIEVPFREKWIFDAEYRRFWDDYKHPNSLDFAGNVRHDGRDEVRAGLQWYFSKHWSSRLDYTYYNSASNVENLFGVSFYSYVRHVASTQLIFDF